MSEEIKRLCIKCNVEKTLDELVKEKDSLYGRERVCKLCRNRRNVEIIRDMPEAEKEKRRIIRRKSYAENTDKEYLRYQRWVSRNIEYYRLKRRSYLKEYTQGKGKQRMLAVRAVSSAVRSGKILKLPCTICGDISVEAHHYKGYSNENLLTIRWLCRFHHLEVHGRKMHVQRQKETL